MTQLTEKFNSHPIWHLLQAFGPEIDAAAIRDGVDNVAIEMLSRLKEVLTFTGKRLSGADPYLIVPGIVDNLSNALESSIQKVKEFNADGNVQHLLDANIQADSVLNCLSQLNIPLTTEDFVAAKEAAELYRSSLEKILSDIKKTSSPIEEEVATIRARLAELSSELTAERTRLTTISTEFQTQFTAAQEARNNEFAQAQKERQDNFVALQNQFSSAQEARSNDFAMAQKERQDRFTTLFTEFSQKLGEQNNEFGKQREEIARLHKDALEILKKEYVDKATGLNNEILARKSEVEKLVGVIGNLGVTSGYLTTANEAKITVRIWQGIAVLAMIGFIAIASFAFLPAIASGGFTWTSFAGRVFVSFTVGVLAAYAASQADKYQKIERQNRRLALELEAIGPFIAPLPTEKQEEFRLTIGERSFGRGDVENIGADDKSPATTLDVMLESKAFQSFVTEIIKAVEVARQK